MAEAKFERKQFLLDLVGVDLNAPLDRVREGCAAVMENWRPEIDGALTIRPGQGTGSALMAAQTPLHSLRRISDSSSGTTASSIVAGAGTHLGIIATDLLTVTDKDSGYSGDPLSIAIHDPLESVKPYAYVADRSRMRKIDQAGNVKTIGLAPPTSPPTAVIDQPRYKIIQETLAGGAWALTGTAAALAGTIRVDPGTVSITAILYDSGNTGWACVRPSSMANMNELMRLRVDTGGPQELVTVEQITRGSAATTIAGIAYEALAGPGLCWVHLTTPVEEIEVGSMVLIIGTTTEYVRVLAVERTPDGYVSFRCSTANSHVAGDSAQAFSSFRAWFANTHAAAAVLAATAVQFNVAIGSGQATLAGAIDLSAIATGLPTQPDDKMHASIWIDKPDLVSEVKLYIDINNGAHNFDQNYLVHVLHQNDFVPVTKGTQTDLSNQQTKYQRELLAGGRPSLPGDDSGEIGPGSRFADRAPGQLTPSNPTDPNQPNRSTQTDAGQSQWSEIIFTIGELLAPDSGRVGSDASRGLKDGASIRIEVIATGAVVVQLDGWWIGGGFGPDVAVDGRALLFRYRARDSSTGAVSNWSPALRGGVRPRRQRVYVFATQHPSADCDKIDFEVYGGALIGWYYAGWSANSSPPSLAFTLSDLEISSRFALSEEQNIHYQPWLIRSTPLIGFSCTVIGTVVACLSGSVSTSLAPGTPVRINGQDHTVYRCLALGGATTTFFEIVRSGGLQTGVPWEIPAPLLQGQPLPIFSARPFHGFYFGLGDPLNPWRLYYTSGDDPDSTRDDHFIDIEADILQNVLVTADGKCFVWSTERVFVIEPAFTTADSGGALFVYRPVGPHGLPFRWAVCEHNGRAVWATRTGICESAGAAVAVLTEDLRAIFPHEGSPGVLTSGFYPPDLSTAQERNLRLSSIQGELFFDYIDTNSTRRTIVRRTGADGRAGWRPYLYSVGAQLHYAEEGKGVTTVLLGGVDGKLYRLARGQADAAGAAIVGTLQTRSEDDGDAVISKYIGDVLADYNTDGTTINLIPGYDNFSSTPDGPFALSEPAGRRQRRLDIGSPAGSGRRARNVGLRFVASVTIQRPSLYLWQLAWQKRPETTLLRAEDYNLVGGGGVKYARGLWIYADTYNVARAAVLEYTTDTGTVASLNIAGITHNALTEVYYPIPSGIYLIGSRLRPTDAATWDFQGYRLDADPAPPLSTQVPEWTDFGEARFVQGVRYEVDTANTPVNMLVRVDENVAQTTIQAGAHSGPVLASGRAIKVYSFDAPFITHLIRSEPSAPCRIWKAEYISEPEPELAYMWWAQQTDCGIEGYKYFGDGQITVRSTDNIMLEFDLDGAGTFAKQAVFYDAVTNTSLARKALRFRCPVMKAKIIQPRIRAASAAGRVSVFQKEFAIQVKGWGQYHVSIDGKPIGVAWQTQNLLGDLHYEHGAKV